MLCNGCVLLNSQGKHKELNVEQHMSVKSHERYVRSTEMPVYEWDHIQLEVTREKRNNQRYPYKGNIQRKVLIKE